MTRNVIDIAVRNAGWEWFGGIRDVAFKRMAKRGPAALHKQKIFVATVLEHYRREVGCYRSPGTYPAWVRSNG